MIYMIMRRRETHDVMWLDFPRPSEFNAIAKTSEPALDIG